MYKVRVLQEIDDRLDAEYYNPAALSTLKKMETKGTVTTFGNLVDEGYRVVYHGTDSINGLKDSDLIPFLSPTQIDANGSISFEDADKLPLYYKERYPKGLGKAGEILVEVKGNVSKVGIVPSAFPKNLMISGSLYKATLDPKRVDSHYVLAFLKSQHGQILKNRLTSNTIINYIAKDALYSIPVIEFKEKAQKYIGDKVRQAEQLGAWAKRLEQVSSFMFANALAELGYKQKKSTKIVRTKLEDRLDPAFYDEKFSFFDESWFKINSEPLKQFIESGSYGVLPSSNSYGKGNVRFIRATDLKNANIDPTCFTYVPEEEVADKAKVSKGDILMEIKGAISTCELAESHLAGTYINGSIFRFTPKGINNAYLACFLSSTIKELYCERVSVNNIISYLDLASLHELPVIRLKNDIEEFLAKNLININLAKKIAFALTRSAKTLVESLIEGQLTEQQLIQAQQALEDGDNSLDQAIISKLSAEGYAIEGATPLFSDVDELYSLLEDAAQAEAEE
ncbi:TPA: restriction endonuclease subunit S [Klebsiella pneumoniae]|nr:restriction endonuclease subunit S [Klebsiella pneumoniae]HBV2636098.1 restriction endonuclease subunit S [Klebsiella pneumoniae]HBV2672518.1 restriction endonuclease subunit S [Klebsiella pneumoniae]HBV2703436.1 restriction endonuclease subunit S [Klebsiella pneumoniae]HBV2892864.1 restriction endonuclease subunit S [Klebsiella pneumoniae]